MTISTCGTTHFPVPAGGRVPRRRHNNYTAHSERVRDLRDQTEGQSTPLRPQRKAIVCRVPPLGGQADRPQGLSLPRFSEEMRDEPDYHHAPQPKAVCHPSLRSGSSAVRLLRLGDGRALRPTDATPLQQSATNTWCCHGLAENAMACIMSLVRGIAQLGSAHGSGP